MALPQITDDVHCWVCEAHPNRPWGAMCCDPSRFTIVCQHGACHCGGAGQPCDHSATEETT